MSNKYEKALSNAFGLDHQKDTRNEVVPIEEIEHSLTTDKKCEIVHETLSTLITKGTNALEDLTDIARTEESPRAYEVVNAMIATIADTSLKMLEIEERQLKIQKLKRDLAKDTQPGNQVINGDVNNTVVIGTTAEILKMIRDQQQPLPIIIDEKK
jgi:hypothetical protein